MDFVPLLCAELGGQELWHLAQNTICVLSQEARLFHTHQSSKIGKPVLWVSLEKSSVIWTVQLFPSLGETELGFYTLILC